MQYEPLYAGAQYSSSAAVSAQPMRHIRGLYFVVFNKESTLQKDLCSSVLLNRTQKAATIRQRMVSDDCFSFE